MFRLTLVLYGQGFDIRPLHLGWLQLLGQLRLLVLHMHFCFIGYFWEMHFEEKSFLVTPFLGTFWFLLQSISSFAWL
jgi:hypothetical protein